MSERTTRAPPRNDEPRAPVAHYATTVLLVGATMLLSMLLRELLNLPDLGVLFLLTVMLTAVWFGRGPSLVAAALGVGAYNLSFVRPYGTLSIEDSRYFLTFSTMFVVGVVMSELASRLRRQEREANAREEHTAALYELTRDLASTATPKRIAASAARHAVDTFAAKALVFVSDDAETLHALGAAPEGTIDGALAQRSFTHDAITNTFADATMRCIPLRAGTSKLGALVFVPREPTADAFLEVFCQQTAAALERARLSEQTKLAELRAQTEEMRASLLSTVSHDLRTPLASITGAATSLRDDANLDAATRSELVESIVGEAERLERLVANLLDMTRLESGALALKRDWVPLDEMIGSALTRLEARLGDRRVTVSIAAEVPLVWVDPVLFAQVFVNLLENAVKYTQDSTPIEILATRDGDHVIVELRDHGPGLPRDALTRIFDKFTRGAHHGVAGAGLGLAICKGIVEAHGGRIVAENHEDGATFRLTIPSGGTPPSVGESP